MLHVGGSGIMMRFRIDKSARHEDYQEDDEYYLINGKQLMKELMFPWANMDRIICADSYFASMPAAEEL